MTRLSDGDARHLVLRAQDGAVDAFEQLVDLHQGRLFRFAYMVLHDRQDAEDVVQEALVLAWRRLHLLEDPAAFGAWITQITHRAATDVVRRAARRSTDSVEHEEFERVPVGAGLGSAGGSRSADPEGASVINAQIEALAAVLQTMEEGQRTCWVLREIDGRSYREISRFTGATEPTVRGRIARARAHIVDRLEEWR